MSKRRILVTGASGGIGRAIALQLGSENTEICVHYRSGKGKAEAVVSELAELGFSAYGLCFDIRDRAATKEALEQDINEKGAFYGVVCNAGLTRDAAFPALTDDDWDSVLRTNLDGFYNVLHPLVMPMIGLRDGGRIVVISSVSGVIGNRGQVNYSASKAGLIGAVKALAVELGKRKITVNCVAPGLIDTDMVDSAPVDVIKNMIPLRRAGKPEEVSGLVEYLMSDNASYVTRQVICVNGGLC